MRSRGVSLFLNPVQDLAVGGRQSNSTYQYVLEADDAALLQQAGAKLVAALKAQPSAITDVDIDVQDAGATRTSCLGRGDQHANIRRAGRTRNMVFSDHNVLGRGRTLRRTHRHHHGAGIDQGRGVELKGRQLLDDGRKFWVEQVA